jgi:hypothetical protein
MVQHKWRGHVDYPRASAPQRPRVCGTREFKAIQRQNRSSSVEVASHATVQRGPLCRRHFRESRCEKEGKHVRELQCRDFHWLPFRKEVSMLWHHYRQDLSNTYTMRLGRCIDRKRVYKVQNELSATSCSLSTITTCYNMPDPVITRACKGLPHDCRALAALSSPIKDAIALYFCNVSLGLIVGTAATSLSTCKPSTTSPNAMFSPSNSNAGLGPALVFPISRRSSSC